MKKSFWKIILKKWKGGDKKNRKWTKWFSLFYVVEDICLRSSVWYIYMYIYIYIPGDVCVCVCVCVCAHGPWICNSFRIHIFFSFFSSGMSTRDKKGNVWWKGIHGDRPTSFSDVGDGVSQVCECVYEKCFFVLVYQLQTTNLSDTTHTRNDVYYLQGKHLSVSWIDKARVKDKTYKWESVWWMTKN